ncbi:MAG: hypothetical protein JO223_01430 [Hyphomicrobiales bacterium]|nr:hypothetical protein [Hyphomicrobiales bacterium]MBV8443910.1 hypothetical protein [Hyphomicrobiales bacterium]
MTGSPQQLEVLRQYAIGLLGTRQAIERAGLDDFADLMIALAENDLDLPKPADTPKRRANVELARALLQPRLRHHAG